jgi:uncharacterized membrane protein
LRAVLNIPNAVFAPIIIVDAVVAYSWMALLVAASGFTTQLNGWLRASEVRGAPQDPPATEPARSRRAASAVLYLVVMLGLTCAARAVASLLPTSRIVTSSTGWTILLVTTAALGLSLIPTVRRFGAREQALGYPYLYFVLAAAGAQASLQALTSSAIWMVVGAFAVVLHGALLLITGRFFRIPLGLLATASQANVGGVVSAPLVGVVYHRSLAPVGLLLAMLGNALGTYLGMLSAWLCRLVLAGQ